MKTAQQIFDEREAAQREAAAFTDRFGGAGTLVEIIGKDDDSYEVFNPNELRRIKDYIFYALDCKIARGIKG